MSQPEMATAFGLQFTRTRAKDMRDEAVVNAFFPDRNFGFLITKSGKEVFFHASGYPAGVRPKLGERVTFEYGEPAKLGKPKQAVNIQITAETQKGGEGGGK